VNTRWLCLRFPLLALDICQRGLPPSDSADTPLAITDKQHIFQVSAAAQNKGVQEGMSLNSAWALSPSLNTVERQPLREQRAITYLANWAYQFTPAVSVGDHNVLFLEVGGSLRLFKGWEPLRAQINDDLERLGFHYQLGFAHTPKAAELLPYNAESSDEPERCLQALGTLPLTQLVASEHLSKNVLQKLQRVGIASLGELLDLPRASIGKRFGKTLLVFLQQLCGERPDPRPHLQLRPEFDSELHFLSGLSSFDMIRLPITQLLQELQQFLIQRQLSCRGFRWRFFHFDRQASVLDIELSRPQQRWDSFFKLSELKLEQINLDSAIESVQLYTDKLVTVEAESQSLFKELSNTALQDTNFLIDKLTSRLGPERLYRLQIQDENLPELQQSKTQASVTPPRQTQPPATKPNNPPPLWLCEPAQAIGLRQQSLYYQGPLELISAPKRFDSHWWQQRQQRDYFIARHAQGSHYWVYFDRGCRRWFLHGIYG